MGVHHLKTEDLERLGRWNPRGDDPTRCPEYLVRSIRNTIKKKDKKSNIPTNVVTCNNNIEDMVNDDEITIKEEPLNAEENVI